MLVDKVDKCAASCFDPSSVVAIPIIPAVPCQRRCRQLARYLDEASRDTNMTHLSSSNLPSTSHEQCTGMDQGEMLGMALQGAGHDSNGPTMADMRPFTNASLFSPGA